MWRRKSIYNKAFSFLSKNTNPKKQKKSLTLPKIRDLGTETPRLDPAPGTPEVGPGTWGPNVIKWKPEPFKWDSGPGNPKFSSGT